MDAITMGLAFSVILNILLLWYISYALRKLLFISENIGKLLRTMKEFSDHLEQLHSLETFYGDTSLQSLIQHSLKIVEEIKTYEEIYSLTTEVEEEEDGEEEEPQ